MPTPAIPTARVDITGQFNSLHPVAVLSLLKNTKIRVVRETELPNTPSNWSSFCDAADDVFRLKLDSKKNSMLLGFFLTSSLISSILLIVNDNLTIVLLTIIVVVIYFYFRWFWIGSHVKKTMAELDKVCEKYSSRRDNAASASNIDGCFWYTLHTEHWGGCNKLQKKYYVRVHGTGISDSGTDSDSDTNNGSDADVEQQAVEVMPNTTSTPPDEFVPPATAAAAAIATTTSINEELHDSAEAGSGDR